MPEDPNQDIFGDPKFYHKPIKEIEVMIYFNVVVKCTVRIILGESKASPRISED